MEDLMSELEIEIKQFNDDLVNEERHLKLYKSLQSLRSNDDFKLVFEQVFIKEQSEELLDKLINPNISLVELEDKSDIITKLDLIRLFNEYFGVNGTIENRGILAMDRITNKDQILEEIRKTYV